MEIQDFYTLAQKVDFSRLHQFRLVSWTWNGQDLLDYGDRIDHYVYLETASVPGREITNVPVPFMGLNFNIPGLATYSGSANYPVVFRSDSFHYLRQVMEHASRKIFNDTSSTGDYNTPNTASTMTLYTIDKYLQTDGNSTPYYTLWGVSLLNTGSIDYNLGDTGQIAKINATLTYHYWTNGVFKDTDTNFYPDAVERQVLRDAVGTGSSQGGGKVGGATLDAPAANSGAA